MKRLVLFSLCALFLIIGAAVPANAVTLPLVNSFDTLDNLTVGDNIALGLNTETYMDGTGSVIMVWDASLNARGYFDWVLPEELDASNWEIEFNVFPPSFITEISLELIDSTGKVAEGWYWDVQDSWYNRFNTITAAVGNQSSGPGNITQVTRIRFDERSNNGDLSWNYWDVTTVTPEPATLCLFGLGGLLLRRRKSA